MKQINEYKIKMIQICEFYFYDTQFGKQIVTELLESEILCTQ